MNRKSARAVQAASASQTSYEAAVIGRGMARAGRNPHLQGHIHEVSSADGRNVGNLFNGRTTHLTRSATAKVVDQVTTQGGKVVERMQLKDSLRRKRSRSDPRSGLASVSLPSGHRSASPNVIRGTAGVALVQVSGRNRISNRS